jgi:hypothetical protein
MKESMSLSQFKKNNVLLGLYVDDSFLERQLGNIAYTIAEQTRPVDLVVVVNSLSEDKTALINDILSKPYATVRASNEAGEIVETKVESTHAINFTVIQAEVANLPVFYNTVFNLANDNGYEFMSICESEDSFAKNWFSVAEKYSLENPGIDIFLPVVRNTLNGVFTGFLNEAVWVEGMSEEAGKADITLLTRFNCINALGALYKVASIAQYSESIDGQLKPMKESIKISHYYEFFLRMIYNDLKVLTIPRVGYEAQVIRKEYYSDVTCKLPQNITELPVSQGGITPQEGSFWMELAKKEYFFDEDRNKQYQPQS